MVAFITALLNTPLISICDRKTSFPSQAGKHPFISEAGEHPLRLLQKSPLTSEAGKNTTYFKNKKALFTSETEKQRLLLRQVKNPQFRGKKTPLTPEAGNTPYCRGRKTLRTAETEKKSLLQRQKNIAYARNRKHALLQRQKKQPNKQKTAFFSRRKHSLVQRRELKHSLLQRQKITTYFRRRLLLPLSRGNAAGPRESVVVVLVTHHGKVGVLVTGVAHVTR